MSFSFVWRKKIQNNAVGIKKYKNVSMTTLIKNWLFVTFTWNLTLKNSVWLCKEYANITRTYDNSILDFSHTFSFILGFAED